MKQTTHQVGELNNAERSTLERLLGHPLRENEQLVIQISIASRQPEILPAAGLPDWCNVFEGLTEEEVADVEKAALRRADLSRRRE